VDPLTVDAGTLVAAERHITQSVRGRAVELDRTGVDGVGDPHCAVVIGGKDGRIQCELAGVGQLNGFLNHRFNLFRVSLINKRAHIGLFVKQIIDDPRIGCLVDSVDDLVVDRLMAQHARDG